MNRVLLATSNPGKIDEMQSLLGCLNVAVVSPAEMRIQLDVDESGSTFAENARIKAEAYALASGFPAIADDSGLVVDALGGDPGVYSARFGGPNLDDAGRVRLLLELLRTVPDSDRSARFISVVALARPGQDTVLFEGSVEGSIAREPRGNAGFGYDPVFVYAPFGATFAEAGTEAKSRVSHRAQAVRKLVEHIASHSADDILGQVKHAQGDRCAH